MIVLIKKTAKKAAVEEHLEKVMVIDDYYCIMNHYSYSVGKYVRIN